MQAPRKTVDDEHGALKAMQEDRLHLASALVCHERCVSSYMTNTHVLWERTCMENCLAKHAQAGIITNLNAIKFQEIEEEAGKGKKRK